MNAHRPPPDASPSRRRPGLALLRLALLRLALLRLALLLLGAATAFGPLPAAGAQAATALSATRPGAPAGDASDSWTVHRMTVHARAVEPPALKYGLLADPARQTPGNAAPLYLLAFVQLAQVPESTTRLPEGQASPSGATEKVSLYLELPAEEFAARRKEVETFLGWFEHSFHDAEAAALRESCDWGLPAREEGFDLLLPHLSPARQLANLLALRARLQIADGNWPAARDTLGAGFALSRDLSRQGFIVQNLVGTAVAALLADHGLREWQQQPDGPNLYWALAGLPRPFSDFAGSMRWERAALEFTFPQLKKLRGGEFAEQDWKDFHVRLKHYVQSTGAGSDRMGADDLGSLALSIALYPQARRHLVEWGRAPEEVREMPVGRVLAEYEFGDYERQYDELVKWASLPFWQGYAGMGRSAERLARLGPSEVPNPLLTFVPAVSHAWLVSARLDREIAAARLVEALRAWAAAHAGKPPARLDELTDTPAPPDPITGQPFDYRVEPDTAGSARFTILCPGPPGSKPKDSIRYEVTIMKP